MTVLPQYREYRSQMTGSAFDHREARRALVRSRREFLRAAAGVTLGSTLLRSSWARAAVAPRPRKVVVVTFGGGARDQETFAQEGQENIPHLMREFIPQGTFFYAGSESWNPGPLRCHCKPCDWRV